MSQSQKTNKPLSFVENCRGVHDDDVAFARVSLKSKVEKVLGVYRFSESLLVDSISVLSSVSHAHPSIGSSSSSLLLFESNRTNEGRMSAKKQRTFKLRAKDFEVGRAVADGWFRNARTRVRGVGKIEIEICSRFSTSLRRDLCVAISRRRQREETMTMQPSVSSSRIVDRCVVLSRDVCLFV